SPIPDEGFALLQFQEEDRDVDRDQQPGDEGKAPPCAVVVANGENHDGCLHLWDGRRGCAPVKICTLRNNRQRKMIAATGKAGKAARAYATPLTEICSLEKAPALALSPLFCEDGR